MKFVTLVLLSCSLQVYCQTREGNWDVYLAQYEDGPGSTVLNMDLIKVAPKKNLPFLIITGVTAGDCDDNGFPAAQEFDVLYEMSDRIERMFSGVTRAELVGTFTSGCDRLDYFYVADTTGLRQRLKYFYKGNFKAYKSHIKIQVDDQWEAYKDFLYPNEETQEYMSNEKVLQGLSEAGDDLTKARPVDHWLYFHSEKDRDAFIRYAENLKFKVGGKDFLKDGTTLPYQLRLVRNDHIDSDSINELTIMLRRKAKEFGGDYSGWETVVIKE